MGKTSRRKGAAGERELAALLRAHGFQAKRDGRLDDDLAHDIPGVHLEAKRCERVELAKWLRQAEHDARGRVPIVAFRQNRQPWRAVVPLVWLLKILAERREALRAAA